jgi:hypothetical protein
MAHPAPRPFPNASHRIVVNLAGPRRPRYVGVSVSFENDPEQQPLRLFLRPIRSERLER